MARTTSDDAPTTRRGPRRAERRAGAVDAFIDLVLEHGLEPRPEDVAERAGVSIASLYRYFSSLEELHHDAIARLADRFPEHFTIEDLGAGPRDGRIARFVAARVALHETLHPLQLLPRTVSRTRPEAIALVDHTREAMADQVRLHFDPELRGLSDARRDDVVASIAALTAVESWEQFRRSHGRTQAQTRRAWSNAIDRLLPD